MSFKFFKNRKNKKQVKESMEQLSQIIDCSEETFRSQISKQSKGYLIGLHNLLVITYNRTKEVKDELVNQIKLGNVPENKDKKTLEGIYSELLKIEHKVFILKEYLKTTHNVDLYKTQS